MFCELFLELRKFCQPLNNFGEKKCNFVWLTEQFSLRGWQSWLLMVWAHSNDSQSDIATMSLDMTTFIKSFVFNALIKLQCLVTGRVKKLFRFQKLGRLRNAALAYPGSRIYIRKKIFQSLSILIWNDSINFVICCILIHQILLHHPQSGYSNTHALDFILRNTEFRTKLQHWKSPSSSEFSFLLQNKC